MKLRSLEEILEKFKEVVHRHRRRYLQRNLRPCPYNCKSAEVGAGHRVLGCSGCGSTNPERCYDTTKFEPVMSKEEVYTQFREELRDPETLLRNYRDVVFFMWLLGVPVDGNKEVDENLLQKVEKRDVKVPQQPVRSSKAEFPPERVRRVLSCNTPPDVRQLPPKSGTKPTTPANPATTEGQLQPNTVRGGE